MASEEYTEESSNASIALSLSGGGYRAAAFHLGSLAALNRLDMLPSVTLLSTVSGGTIVGAAWACSLVEDVSFKEFEISFKSFLSEVNIVSEALSELRSSSQINGFEAMPSLIRSASIVYDGPHLFNGKQFGILEVSPPNRSNPTQLQDISFNSTDFRTGNSFRFQQSNSGAVYSGNKYFRIQKAVTPRIRIADIVAASSCFPGGFEPLRFPADFSWGGSEDLSEIRKMLGDKFKEEIGLMDGGIFDNQGIDSISLMYEREGYREGNKIDLYILSDTSQRLPLHLNTPVAPNKNGLTLRSVSVFLWLLMVCAAITFVAVATDAYQTYQEASISIWRGIFLYAIPVILSLGTALGLYKLRSISLRFLREFDAASGIDVWAGFKNLSTSAVMEIVMTRFRSVLAMTTSVFMKRIRDLGYKRIYGNSKFDSKRISNMIYDLDNESQWRDYVRIADIIPSQRLRILAVEAEKNPTTLWFSDRSQMDKIVECGEATMYFNILRYLLEHRAQELADSDSNASDLYRRAKEFWSNIQ